MPWTLYRSILRELLLVAAAALAGLTALFVFVLTMQLSLQLPAAGTSSLLRFAPILAMGYQTYLLPISILAATAYVYSRLSSEMELTALRTCGVPLRMAAVPALMIGLLGVVPAIAIAFWVGPESYAERDQLKGRAIASALNSLRPGEHNLVFDGVSVSYRDYVDGTFNGLVLRIYDDRGELSSLSASKASLRWDETSGKLMLEGAERVVQLTFDESTRELVSETTGGVRVAEFDLNLGLKERTKALKGATNERLMSGLRDEALPTEAKRYYTAEWVRRLSFALAPLVLAFLGGALGAAFRTRNALVPVATSLLVGAGAYFGCQRFADWLASSAVLADFTPWGIELVAVLLPAGLASLLLIRKVGG